MTADFPLQLIPLLPFLGAALALLIGRRLGKNVITLTGVGTVGLSFLATVRAVLTLHHALPPGGALVGRFFDGPWMKAGQLTIAPGLIMDHLTAIMCLVVTGIGLLIHIYSTAYMEQDARYTRFFAFLNLFMGSMLVLVLGDSLPVTFVGWEGVGLCSYLLIGFWHDNDAFASAGKKAFIVNRIGDFGFLLAMFILYSRTGTLKYAELAKYHDLLLAPIWWGMPAAYFIGLLVLLGATGKSAQIPLYVWLPDAMAGPTPVSALIHAATMVTAGVYVVARMHFVFEVAPSTLVAVAVIGSLTALFAATIGMAQRDLKKVLAYSTISQLGFMFAGVGSYLGQSANYQAGIFHLVTHAFFKAGLFLAAGSVMHGLAGEGDIMKMGGLKKWMPHTRITFFIYCLAIAGIVPLSGFWSKDAILGGMWFARWPATPGLVGPLGGLERFFAENIGHILYVVLLLAAACTAFYMFRLYFLVFEGEYRGHHGEPGGDTHAAAPGAHHAASDGHHLPHESPPLMTGVLWILALGSIVVGLFGVPEIFLHETPWVHELGEWLSPVLAPMAHEESASEFLITAAVASMASLAGIALAWALYARGVSATVENFVARFPGLYEAVYNKYYIDELYDALVVRPTKKIAYVLWKAFDAFVIDLLLVNGAGFFVSGVGKLSRYLQNGDLQRYIVAIILGAATLLAVATHYDVWKGARFEVSVDGREVEVVAHGSGPTGKRIQYCVDWESDDHCSARSTNPKFAHSYIREGAHTITVEAYDPRWSTQSRETRTVKVP